MKHPRRFFPLWLAATLILLFTMLLCTCIGSVSIPIDSTLAALWNALWGLPLPEGFPKAVVFSVRLPRVLCVALTGAALSLCGAAMQGLLRNPLADGSTLGVSSGAKLAVGAVMIFGMKLWGRVPFGAVMTAAFVGAMISMGFVLLMSRRVHNMSMLVVSGVMIGYICSAITELVVTFASDAEIVNLHNWSRGSFSGMTWENVAVMTGVVAVTFFLVFLMAKPLSAYQLGEVYARNLGVDIRLLRIAMVLLSSILSACIVAFAGPISFVGIAAPHLVKSLLGTAKPIWMIPACFLGGSVFCLFCDLLARTMFAPTELSISTVTAIFGAPVVLWIMVRRNKEKMA